jgi:hypothetical protein
MHFLCIPSDTKFNENSLSGLWTRTTYKARTRTNISQINYGRPLLGMLGIRHNGS